MIPVLFVVAAAAVIAVLIVIGMRQRWNDGTRPGWTPGGAWSIEPLPRHYGTLTVLSYLVLVPGVVLAGLLRLPALGIACLIAYAVVWVARNALLRWGDATTPIRKVTAVAAPVGFVAGLVLVAVTRSLWWFAASAAAFLLPTQIFSYIDRQRRRSSSRN